MSRAVPRHVVVALLLLPVFWLGSRWARLTTTMEIDATETGIKLTVEGKTLEWPIAMSELRGITVVVTETFFPFGGDVLALSDANGGEITRLPIPRRFDFPPTSPLTSDWWIDLHPQQREWALPPVQAAPPWHIRATFTGRGQAGLRIEGDKGPYLTAGFRAGSYDNDLYILDDRGKIVGAKPLGPQFLRDSRTSLELPFNASFLAALLVIGFYLLSRVGRNLRMREWPAIGSGWIGPVLAAQFLLSLWIAWWILDARPHFQDDLGYLLRAKWLLAGHLTLPKPPNAEHFHIPFSLFVGDRWISQYPIGWSALLVPGEYLRLAWVVSPICATVAAWATWRIGCELWGNAVGLGAAILLLLSPLAALLSGSMLSHAATSMWLSLFLLLFLRGWRGKGHPRELCLAGLALGFAFSTRPLSAAGVGVVGGLFVIAELVRRKFNRRSWSLLGLLVLGGILGSLPALIDNWLVTGRPWVFAYNLNFPNLWSTKAYLTSTFWTDRTLALLPPLSNGWGWPWLATNWFLLTLPFAIALVPWLVGRAARFDWLVFGMIAILPVAFLTYAYGGLHGFGPRYYADSLFALMLLVARGFQVLSQTGSSGSSPSPLPRLVAVGGFVILTIWNGSTIKSRLDLYRGYNFVDDRIERRLAEKSITHGLILLDAPAYLNWVRVARLLSPDLHANLVFAEKLPDNTELLKTYAGWPVYVVDENRVRPYTPP